MTNKISNLKSNRRQFLVGSASAGMFLAIAPLSACSDQSEQVVEMAQDFEPTIWSIIAPDGKITINCSKAEMGQHVGTGLARILADELEANWDDVEVVHVDTDPKWGNMMTGGSWSIHQTFDLMSRAGAAGRIAMIEAGAAMMGVAADSCSARNSRVISGDNSVSYAEIVSSGTENRSFTDEEMGALTLKSPADYRLIGKETKALDIPEKIDGSAQYGIDFAKEGMVYARPIVPPTRFGSSVTSFDDTAAKEIPGYIQTVEINDPSETCQGWLGVVAENYPAAIKAADAVTVEWNPGPGVEISDTDLQAESRRLIADPDAGSLFINEGDVDAAMNGAETIVENEFTTGAVLHMPLEPMNAVAYFEEGKWHFHSGTQWQSLTMPMITKAMGVTEAELIIHTYQLGGGFGRRLYADYLVPAGLTSQAIGKPVKMVFTREDDTWLDCARTPTVHRMRSGVDADGNLVSYEHNSAGGWPIPNLAPFFLYEAVEGTGDIALFSISGADHWYDMPDQRVRTIENKMVGTAFQPGWLRAVGAGYVSWPIEQQIDALAHHAGRDPIEYRLSMLTGLGKNAGSFPNSVGGGTRMAAVLERVAELSGWADRDTLPDDTGLGVAVGAGQERNMPTWVAVVAKVKVDKETGEVKVEKITSVVDAGTIVHPNGALAQVEGSTLWGMSLALMEGTKVENGTFADRNLDSYTPMRMDQVPELNIEFMENDHFPTGLGEPGLIAVAPAIANAIHAAVGVRMHNMPIRSDDVKAALNG